VVLATSVAVARKMTHAMVTMMVLAAGQEANAFSNQ
jgi:hypothetical protein